MRATAAVRQVLVAIRPAERAEDLRRPEAFPRLRGVDAARVR